MSTLRPVTTRDEQRADAIASWLDRFGSDESRRTMASALRCAIRCADDLPNNTRVDIVTFEWELLADELLLRAFHRAIRDRVDQATTNKYLSAVRSLLPYLARSGLARADLVANTLEQTRLRRPDTSPLPPLNIDSDELRQILRCCHNDPQSLTGARDLALVALTAGTGARRHESVSLDTADIDRKQLIVHFRTLKGGGRRDAVLHPQVAVHLDHWLDYRGQHPGPLFPALRKGGRILDQPLSTHQFWKILRHRAGQAGINPLPAPHDLRRWFVSTMLDNGADVFTTMRAVGHRNPATTALYDRRTLKQLRATVDRLPIPDIAELDDVGD